MPLFTFDVDVRGMRRRFSALVDATTPAALEEPLLRTGGFVRAHIKRNVFDVEGPGWAPLDPETQKRKLTESHVALLQDTGRGRLDARSPVRKIVREADAMAKASDRAKDLTAKLDERRAKGRKTETLEKSLVFASMRQAKAFDYIRTWRVHAFTAGIGSTANLVAYARAEVARAKRHGEVIRAYKADKAAGMTFSDQERRAILRKGARRYKASEESTRIIGGLRNTLGLHLYPGRIEIFSKAFIGAIHNFGGTAGHGAQIKARTFMIIPPSALDFLVDRLREKMIKAWHEAV